MVHAVDQLNIFKNNRCKVRWDVYRPTVKFIAMRRTVAIIFRQLQKSVFFDESERFSCVKPAVNIRKLPVTFECYHNTGNLP